MLHCVSKYVLTQGLTAYFPQFQLVAAQKHSKAVKNSTFSRHSQMQPQDKAL